MSNEYDAAFDDERDDHGDAAEEQAQAPVQV
jgi:hypothetical protein